MLRKPISSDEDIMQVFNAAKDGLLFMDEVLLSILEMCI